MMIFPSMPLPIVKFPCSCVVHLDAKHIRETFFIYTLVFWSALAEETQNMAEDLLPLFQLLKHRLATCPPIFRRTLFLLLMDKFSWRQIFFTKVFVRQSTLDFPCLAWVLALK